MIIRKYTQNYWGQKTSPVQEKRYTPANERAYLFALLDRLKKHNYFVNGYSRVSNEDLYIFYKQYGLTLQLTPYPKYREPHTQPFPFEYIIQILPNNWQQNHSKRELRYQSHTFIRDAHNTHDKINARSLAAREFDLPF